jgi:hypothetical protein
MSHPVTRKQFSDYCLRRLGWPVIEINVDGDQVNDRIDDALAFWTDYHYDGTEKLFFKHRITAEDLSRKYILVPDRIVGVTGIMPFDESAASVSLFDLRYSLRLHDLYDFTSVSYVSYTITLQHLRTLNLLFSGTPQFRFHRHRNRLMLDINWDSDVREGSYVILECYGKINPDRIVLDGTVSIATGSNALTGNNTTFDAFVAKDDEIFVNTANGVVATRVTSVNSNVSMNVSTTFATTESGLTVYQEGSSDVWGDRVLQDLATAMIKRQWGNNLKKFAGIQMPGGTTLNGQIIYDEAEAELKEIKQEFISYNTGINEFFIG